MSALVRGKLRLALAAILAAGCARTESSEQAETDTTEDEARAVEPLPSDLEHRIENYIGQYGRNWPSFRFHGTVLVARAGEVAVHRSFGFADFTQEVPNEPATRFRIGTLSSQLVAAAAMRMVDRGELSLDATVADFHPDWPKGKSITLYHLLSNQSGIPTFTEGEVFRLIKHLPQDLGSLLQRVRGGELKFEPGTDVEASNANPIVLASILEQVTGKSIREVVAREVIDPLKLEATRWGTTESQQAVGLQFNENEFLESVTSVSPGAFGPAGAYLSDANDLHTFALALTRGELLSEQSTQQTLGLRESDLGFSWVTHQMMGRRVAGWPGLIDGFNSTVLLSVDDETVVIVLANTEVVSAGQVAQDIMSMVYGADTPKWEETREVPVPLADQKSAAGRYVITRKSEELVAEAAPARLDSLTHVSIEVVGEHLRFDVPAHGRKIMHPLGNGEFFFKDVPHTRAKVITRADGTGKLIVTQASGTELEYLRVQPPTG